jgi:small multidrug resistance family-3 protein
MPCSRHYRAPAPQRLPGATCPCLDRRYRARMVVLRSILLFLIAAVAEIGGAWLVWQGVRENRGLLWMGGGVIALGLYGFVATFQPDANFGRILAAYGGIFVAGSLLWGMIVDGFRPDRYDLWGAGICLVGVAVIMYAPRAGALDA